MARTTTELADMLNYRLREHLGARVDYRAHILPNEIALSVEMLQPEFLRGLTFIFRESEPLPDPIRGHIRWTLPIDPNQFVEFNPNERTFTTNAIDIETPIAAFTVQEPLAHARIDNVTVPADLTYNGIRRTIMPATIPATGMRTREQEARLVELERIYITVPMTDTQITERMELRRLRPYSPPVQTMTPEQQERFEELAFIGNEREWTNEENTEYSNLSRLVQCPNPNPPRLRVRVWRDVNTTTWHVTASVGSNLRDLPDVRLIRYLLPPGDKRFLAGRHRRYQGTASILIQALRAGLSAQSLTNALMAWLTANENPLNTQAEAEAPGIGLDEANLNLLRAQPATLEVGGIVYRLTPCRQTDTRPLIRRVRERALTVARAEATTLRDRANADARVVVSEAESRATAIRREAEQLRRNQSTPVPDWVRDSHRPHYWDGANWRVQMYASCYLRDIRYTVSQWQTVLHWNPVVVAHAGFDNGDSYYNSHKMALWYVILENGNFNYYNIRMPSEWVTTHITSHRACMELEGLPGRVDSLERLKQVETAISRGLSVINLNSPLSADYYRYYPDFAAQIPPVVVKLLRSDIAIIGDSMTMAQFREANPSITWDRAETIAQEQDGTFDVSRPPVPLIDPVIPEETVEDVARMIVEAQRVTGVRPGELPPLPERR